MPSNQTTFRPKIESEVESLALGCVVDNTFVAHLLSGEQPDIFELRALFIIYKKRILVQLKTSEEEHPLADNEQTVHWIDAKYELSLNLSQVKTIDLDNNHLVLKLSAPPLLFKIVDIEHISQTIDDPNVGNDDNHIESELDLDSGLGEAVDCEQGIDVFDDIDSTATIDDFIGLRLRTSNLLKLDGQLFSKTNCIRFTVKDKDCLKEIVSSIGLVDPLLPIGEKTFRCIAAKVSSTEELLRNNQRELPFAVQYSLEALTNISYQLLDALHVFDKTYKDFADLVNKLTNIDGNATEKALFDLSHNLEDNLDIRPMEDLDRLFHRHRSEATNHWTNRSVIMIRRCILTPTRMLLLPALPQQQSRFLRLADPEFVLRVLIKDEDMQMLTYTAGKTSLPFGHKILDQINHYLNHEIVRRIGDGLRIGGRIYHLLGASTSQLRDHGMVMYAIDTQNRTVEDIRRQLGRLEVIRNPAKFIARIGQTMSQSMGFVQIDWKDVEEIDDIEGGTHQDTQEPYVFSDGIGRVSQQMAEEICNSLQIEPTSAFQFRLAGFKGMLVVDPNLTHKRFQLRPKSMKKFESDSVQLDILKVAEPRRCYLNRPLVVILDYLGIKNEVFLQLLYDRLKELISAFDSDTNAIKIMRTYSAIDFDFEALQKANISVLSEPFFLQIVQSILTKASADLKNKARIQIPYDWARVMYGVLDESLSLEYGQVFVQYTHSDGTKRVLTGEVVVTKYPCMHPGDVRRLTAVDVPALHHIWDCVVFPAKGERPHPDEMAGSDLDGDEYSVIWYEPLIFRGDNYIAMRFPNGAAQDLGRNITDQDLLNFYQRFILNNQVGLLAISHLAWADLCGLNSRRCNILAHKYAVALDFAKTGINKWLRNEDKPKQYPDFMMKDNEKPTYRSDKALGLLFRKNCFFHQLMQDFGTENQDWNSKMNPDLIDPKGEQYMTEAKHIFQEYKIAVKELMERFGIESESALMSVTFTKKNKSVSSKTDGNDIYDLIANIVKRLIADFLLKFESTVEERELPVKASAWYRVSHEMNDQRSDTYYGFGWIPAKYLVRLVDPKRSPKRPDLISQTDVPLNRGTLVSLFNSIVIKYAENHINELRYNDRTRLEKKLNSVLDRLENEDNDSLGSFNGMLKVFEQMSVITQFERHFEVGLTSIMAYQKCRRLDITKGLTFLMTNTTRRVESSGDCILIAAITEGVTDLLVKQEMAVTEGQESRLIATLKKRTGVRQIDVCYGFKGHESFMCAIGQRSAVRKFKHFINDKHLYANIRHIVGDLSDDSIASLDDTFHSISVESITKFVKRDEH